MQENNNIPWTRKYQPKKTSEIISQEEAIKQIRSFASSYKKQKKKAAIIFGPVGSGKTISVYAVAHELDLEIIEVNASDFRNEEQINSIVGASSRQMSLFSKGKIILIDEVDGLSGKEDRGGINALAKLIEESAFPIVCTAVDPFDKKLSNLRKKSMLIEFSKPDYNDIINLLASISKKENIKFKEDDLKTLARRSGGDIRAAINDLQIIAGIDREISREAIEELGQREQTETILDAVMKVLKTTDPKIAMSAFESIDEKIDEVFLWIDENLPKEYEKPADLARAYDFISKADIMKSRITRWQHWRFLIYVSAYLSAGVAVSKDEKYKKFVQYGPTGRLLKIWMANQKYLRRKAIAEKVADRTHTSAKRALQDTLPYLQQIFRNDKEHGKAIADSLDLSEEEVEWLRK